MGESKKSCDGLYVGEQKENKDDHQDWSEQLNSVTTKKDQKRSMLGRGN